MGSKHDESARRWFVNPSLVFCRVFKGARVSCFYFCTVLNHSYSCTMLYYLYGAACRRLVVLLADEVTFWIAKSIHQASVRPHFLRRLFSGAISMRFMMSKTRPAIARMPGQVVIPCQGPFLAGDVPDDVVFQLLLLRGWERIGEDFVMSGGVGRFAPPSFCKV